MAEITLYPAFDGGVYVFEPPNLGAGTWLHHLGEPLPGELAVRVPAMAGQHFSIRKARCRILLEDALARAQDSERTQA